MSPNINPEYVISLQGQEYCTYRGVLDRAHALGLEGIRTRVLQVPGADNDHVAIVEAEVRLKDGRVFVDVADASPKNVPARLAPALIRMASTRAKGRALRDAVNIGETLAEELPDVDTEEALPETGQGAGRSSAPVRARAAGPQEGAPHPEEASEAAAAPPRGGEAAPPRGLHVVTSLDEPEADRLALPPRAERAPAPREETPARGGPLREVPAAHYAADPEEAPTAAPPAGAPTAGAGRATELVCSNPECGRTVTQGQHNFSVKTFGVSLCPACQRRQQAQGRPS